MNDIDKAEFWNFLKLDFIEFERLTENYCCGEFFGLLCGFGDHLIVQHYWNTGNKQTLRIDV